MSKEIEYLEIPNEIKLNSETDIIFNEKQILWVDCGEFAVSNSYDGWNNCTENFVLVPCELEDLEVSDTIIRKYDDVIIINGVREVEVRYDVYKVLKNKRFCGLTKHGIEIYYFDGYSINHDWYKVVKREELE